VSLPIPFRRAGGDLALLVGSTGVRMRGNGEWQLRRHGPGRRRQWRKVPRARDGATGHIRAVEVTSSQLGDGPVLPDLLAQIPADQAIGTVTAEGAHDTRTCQAAITERGGPAFVGAPVHRTGS